MAEQRAIRVILVDDQPLVRAGLKLVLGEGPDIEVVGEASDGSEVLELARRVRPHVAIMDVRMRWVSGVEATGLLRQLETPPTC